MSAPQIAGPAGKAGRSDGWSGAGFIRFGLVCVLILGGGVGGWAATAKLSGAVIASGQLRVQSQKQVVQHPDGGVVGEILARDGDEVAAGDVLLRLDDTLLRADLAALESQLFEIMARRGRLEAEITGAPEIAYDPELVDRAKVDARVANLMAGQRALFARAATRSASNTISWTSAKPSCANRSPAPSPGPRDGPADRADHQGTDRQGTAAQARAHPRKRVLALKREQPADRPGRRAARPHRPAQGPDHRGGHRADPARHHPAGGGDLGNRANSASASWSRRSGEARLPSGCRAWRSARRAAGWCWIPPSTR